MSRENTNVSYEVFGHTRQRANLSRLFGEGRLPSTLMFVGLPSIGKRGVALELTRTLLCNDPRSNEEGVGGGAPIPKSCGECKACVLSRTGNHPDVHEITLGGEEGATVDDLRSLLDQLNLTSFLGGRKVALLNNVENLSIVGANVLLKSLEEPRPSTYFILIVSNASKLPATLLSRCQRWYFDRLSPADMKRIISGLPDLSAQDSTLLLAEGSFASVETMRSRPGMYEEVEEAINAAYVGQDARILQTAQSWAADKDSIRDLLTLLLAAVHRRLHASSGDAESAAVWALTIQNVLDAEYLILERHVSPLTVLLTTLRQCRASNGPELIAHPNAHPALVERL